MQAVWDTISEDTVQYDMAKLTLSIVKLAAPTFRQPFPMGRFLLSTSGQLISCHMDDG